MIAHLEKRSQRGPTTKEIVRGLVSLGYERFEYEKWGRRVFVNGQIFDRYFRAVILLQLACMGIHPGRGHLRAVLICLAAGYLSLEGQYVIPARMAV